jgi:hypothetical protein
MDQLRSLMQSALAQRLAEHLRAEIAPVQNIPNLRTASVQDRLVGGLRLGTLAPRDLLDTLGLAREGIDYGAKALTGLGALETQKIQQIDNPVLRNAANAGSFLLPGGPITSILALATEAGRDHLPSPVGPADARNAGAAFDQARGNVVSRLRQANEGFARDSPLAAGIFNQLYNPLTYLTGGGTAEERALQQSGRISRGLNIDLNTVNGILYPEGHLIGKASSAILGPAVRGVLDRTGLNDILRQRYDLPAAPEAGDLARYLEPQGLPVPDKVPNEPSPLVRDKAPNVLAMARLEAARSKAAAQPALFDLQTTGGQLPRLFDDRLQATGDPLGELVAQVAPPPAPPPPVQPIADLLGAAQRVAQPNRLEQLLGAARKVFPEGAGTPLTAAKQASADLAPPAATPRADPLGLMRDLLKSGDNGKGMIYAPADPQFWQKRVGVDPAAVPGLLRQLTDEGSLAPDHTGDLLNTYLAGGERTPVAPDLPGGSLDLPAMPDYPNMTRAEAIGNLTPAEVGQLVELAYRNPVARRKALLAHPDPADVASAALDRIEGNNDLMRNLHVWNPDLAGKVTYLPEPDTGGLPGDYTPTAEDLANGWGSEISLPFDQQEPRRTPWADLSPAEMVKYIQSEVRQSEGTLRYVRAKYGADSPDATEWTQNVARARQALKDAQQAARASGGEDDNLGLMARLKGTPQTPEERAAWQARYAGQSQAGTDILARGDRVAGSAVTQADLNALSPEERVAALRQLTAEPDTGLTPQPRPGPGGIAGWLTRPLTTGPGVTRLGVAGSGGLIGAAAGGLAPAESEDQRRIHALQGAAVGAGLGLGTTTKAGQNIVSSLPVAKEFSGNLIRAANVAQREAMDRSNKGITNFTNLANSWRVQQTSTIRNLIQDELTARLWNANAGVRQQMMNDNWSSLVQLYNLGKTNGYDALPMQTTTLLDKWGLTGYMPNIGAGFNNVNESLIKDLSAADMAKMEAIFAGLNPAQGGVPLAGVALGAVKGYTRAWQEKIFSTLNEFTRLAARHAAFQDEFAPAMQVAAHDFVARHGAAGALDPAAGFSAADVGQALGQQAQDEWAQQVEKVTHLAEQRALDIHGDFTRKAAGEPKSWGDRAANLFNTAVPFSSWALKAYPRTAAMMLDHPGVSLAIMLLTMGQAEKAQREGKAGLVGGVPIDADTPLVGGIARKMLGNFPGQAYVNLLGSLTPVSTSALLSSDQPVNANLYQRAGEALDRAGFSFSPLIQAAVYGMNKDFQRPAPLSRTAGLEMALPGPDMPSLALGPLNTARVAAGGSAQHTTTEDRKLAELFYLSTGHQIATRRTSATRSARRCWRARSTPTPRSANWPRSPPGRPTSRATSSRSSRRSASRPRRAWSSRPRRRPTPRATRPRRTTTRARSTP